jgi:opacity protein-like surface antigen
MKKLALMFALLCAPAAWAQYGEFWFNAGETLYANNGLGSFALLGGNPDDVRLEDGFRFSFRVAFNGDSYFGHEVQYAYSRAQLAITSPGTPSVTTKQGMAVHIGGYNFLVYANHEGNRFRPFGTGGVHFANYVPPGSSAYSGGGDNKFGFSYGGGLKVRVVGPWAVRFDVRQYTNPKPFQGSRFGITTPANGWIRMNEFSAGFGIVF